MVDSGINCIGIIRAVFDALASTMQSWMPLGHNIKINGLGVFSLSLGFDSSTPSEEAIAKNKQDGEDPKKKYRHVCIKDINFRPDPELLKEMNREATFDRVDPELLKKMNREATFDRVNTDVVVPQKSKYSREERLEKAKAIIDQHGFMTLNDYAIATGQCRASASNDLKRMVADANSGITTRGSYSHKVWIASR